MIVFTIYENGGNAGVFGASFSCAVFGVRGSSGGNNGARINAGALCSTGAAGVRFWRSLLRSGGRSFVRSFVRAVGRSVLNGYARAGRRSKAIKLRRECGCAAGVRGRRASVAHQRANYFFPAQRGGGARKGGAGLR